jgi:RimJ/RimL family protein N-acetyltransferase
MKTIKLRPAELDRDFGKLANLFSIQQAEPTSEARLKLDYREHKGRIIRLMIAEDEQGALVGFNWVTRSRYGADQAYFYLMVMPGEYGQGVGHQLYADLEAAAQNAGISQLQVNVRDDFPAARAFADALGFIEQTHSVGLVLDLDSFNDVRYDAAIEKLKYEGFQFSSLEDLGNTDDARRKLYHLNDTTNMELIIPKGQHVWLSFSDFKQKVCQTDWFIPGGQLVAIDRGTGIWAAMSAITRYEGSEHAYNLHTGVDRRYHGRNLAQAVLVLALRYARHMLKVSSVHTDEDAHNLSSLAIYHELGYTSLPGIFSMEKTI